MQKASKKCLRRVQYGITSQARVQTLEMVGSKNYVQLSRWASNDVLLVLCRYFVLGFALLELSLAADASVLLWDFTHNLFSVSATPRPRSFTALVARSRPAHVLD